MQATEGWWARQQGADAVVGKLYGVGLLGGSGLLHGAAVPGTGAKLLQPRSLQRLASHAPSPSWSVLLWRLASPMSARCKACLVARGPTCVQLGS